MAMSCGRKIAIILGSLFLLFVLVVVIGIALIFSALRGHEPVVRDNSVLILKIDGELPDYVPDTLANRLFGNDDPSLTTVVEQLRKAKVDKRIGGVLLEINMLGAGWGKAEELRGAIADFRASGKPIYAFIEVGLNKEYYIATACERVYVSPAGDLYINGFAADVMFFRGSLDKLGVYPDVAKIGKYKNAPDQFTRKEMTPEHREVINSIVDDLFNRFINTVAETRRKSPDEVRALIDNAPLGAQDAVRAGLADGANYRDEVENELKKRLGYKDADELRITKAEVYRQVSPDSVGLNRGERIAVIYASGDIWPGKSENSATGGQSVGSDTMVKAIGDAARDKTIKAIVIRVDSPGGVHYASDAIWHAVEVAKQKKPVVVSMGDLGASGGYYIACNANKIIAEPSTLTGSIGIFAGKPVVKGLYDWLGITNEYVLRGKNAGMFREAEKFSPEERAKLEATLKTKYYDEFVPKVAKGRGRDPEYIDSIGQGRVWTGAQAREKGLIDDFGGLDKAVEVARELAGIPADKGVKRVILPYPRSFFDGLFGGGGDEEKASIDLRVQQQSAAFAALPGDVRRTLQYAAMMDRMKRGEIMALMPFDLRIK
ncbi:MAG TPA: signal peptide peptidase SppA [Pyrinomonadaceae bacterium]|nr:signal peptide peptidase SppA [Pyrinomonadaceae bacterium]